MQNQAGAAGTQQLACLACLAREVCTDRIPKELDHLALRERLVVTFHAGARAEG